MGIENKARGGIGCYIVLSEWKEINGEWNIVNVKSVKVDGKKIKENVWYQLKNNKFMEVK